MMMMMPLVQLFLVYCLVLIVAIGCLPIEKYRKPFVLFLSLTSLVSPNIKIIELLVLDSTQSQTELNWDKEAFGDSSEVPGVSETPRTASALHIYSLVLIFLRPYALQVNIFKGRI